MIPNYKHIVEEMKVLYPTEWKNAHTGNTHTEDFIKILAWELYGLDPRFGLNGKRGNPNDLSDDVVNCIGEGVGHTPEGIPCNVIDVIRAAGSPSAAPSWTVFQDPQEASGAWVKPQDPFIVDPPTPVPPTIPPYQGDAFYMEVSRVLDADYKTAGQALDKGCGAWFGRVDYDIYVGGMLASDSIKKHRPEWLEALKLPLNTPYP